MTCFMALDIGTSAVKATLFDARGRQLAVDAREYELERPAPDRVEIDPEVYWTAARQAVAAVLNASGIVPADVPGLGVTSQGETLIVLDDRGRPLRKAIVWLDNRAVEEARAIAGAFDLDEVYRRTGQQEIVPGWTASKILWMRRHEPALFGRAARFLMVEDYLVYRLTGRFVTDHALNPSTLYYDLTASDWWDEMLGFLGISRRQLPELCYSGRDGTRVRADIGLSDRTIVTTSPIDQITGAVGAGNVAPGMVTETTGSALAICAASPVPVYDPLKRVGLYRHATPDSYVLLPWVPTAGMALRWFRDQLGGDRSFAELAAEAMAVPPGSEGLTVLPHFSGAVCPRVNSAARAVFHGLSLGHRRAHLVRALMESVAYMVKDNLRMLETLGVRTGAVRCLGGGARSEGWLQIKADVLNRPVETVETEEAACLGAAVLGALGAGHYADLDEAVAAMVRPAKVFAPEPRAAEVYAGRFEDYCALNELLLPTFGDAR